MVGAGVSLGIKTTCCVAVADCVSIPTGVTKKLTVASSAVGSYGGVICASNGDGMIPINIRTTTAITAKRNITAPIPLHPDFFGSGSVRRTAIGRVE